MAQTNLKNFRGIWKQWTGKGCTCGETNWVAVTIPVDSKAVVVLLNGKQKGPVTGIEYDFIASTVAVDVHTSDADHWISEHKARLPQPVQQGRLARVATTV